MVDFTKDQTTELQRLLPRDAVRTRRIGKDDLKYLPGWFVINQANRIFGFGNWSYRVLDIAEVFNGTKGSNLIGAIRATVEVKVGDVVRQDVGMDSWDTPPDAILSGLDKAHKGAVTDAMKRAFRTFGNPFGNSLYDKINGAFGFSAAAEALLDAVESLDSVVGCELWWRQNRDAISELDRDEQEEIRGLFCERHHGIVSGTAAPARLATEKVIDEPKPLAQLEPPKPAVVEPPVVAVPAPTQAPVAPPPVAPVPQRAEFAAPAPKPVRPTSPHTLPKASTVSSALVAIEGASTVVALREVAKSIAGRTLTTIDRDDLNTAYSKRLGELDKPAWYAYRTTLVKTDAEKDALFAEAAAALKEDVLTEEQYGKVVRMLGGTR